jgi:hypothetical protein
MCRQQSIRCFKQLEMVDISDVIKMGWVVVELFRAYGRTFEQCDWNRRPARLRMRLVLWGAYNYLTGIYGMI